MTNIREKYWIQRLRQLVKRVRKRCYGCKRFPTVAFQIPNLDYYHVTELKVAEHSKLLALTMLDLSFTKRSRKQKVKPIFCCLHAVFQEQFTLTY